MTEIDAQFIEQCSLTVGQFDSYIVNQLVPLYRDQSACLPVEHFSEKIREQFENLLSCHDDDFRDDFDTPLTRIELAVMMHFKQTYLTSIESILDSTLLKWKRKFNVNDELSNAYCLLIAQVSDRMSIDTHLIPLAFRLNIRDKVNNLFELYRSSRQSFPEFVSNLIESAFFDKYLVREGRTLRGFQLFIRRYEKFLKDFSYACQSLPDDQLDESDLDRIPDAPKPVPMTSRIIQTLSQFREECQLKKGNGALPMHIDESSLSRSPEKPTSPSSPPPVSPPIRSTMTSSNIPRRGLCVVINVHEFTETEAIEARARSGSEKDLDLIRIVFEGMNFTVLTCKRNFTKKDFEEALAYIDDPKQHGNHDCLVMFIMSHGLLQTILTADGQEVIIRDIIRRFSDSSKQTIWAGKPRLFFFQACRTERPQEFPIIVDQEVKKTDLSPNMLVAFSCSPNEASVRYKDKGAIFIQMLCMTIFKLGHEWHIQSMLDLTRQSVIKLHQCIAKDRKEPARIQTPEFIEQDFDRNFRFTSQWMAARFASFPIKDKIPIRVAFGLWIDPIQKLAVEDSQLRLILLKSKAARTTNSYSFNSSNRLIQQITT